MRPLTILLFILFVAPDSYGQEQVYDNSFIRFHVYGSGEPVFVLSGGPGNNCMQEEDVAIAIGKRYQAILLEQRGTGLSVPPQLNKKSITLEACLNDLLFVMDSLKIKKAKFYGHSWGAMYASAFAVRHPEKVSALILTGPGFLKIDTSYQNRIFSNRMKKLSADQRERFFRLGRILPSRLSVEEKTELDDLRATFNTYDTTNREWKFNKIKRGATNIQTQNLLLQNLVDIGFDITRQVAALKIPIYIITCKEDPLAFLTDEYKRLVPSAEVYWMDHCGHFPMYEQPVEFYNLLLQVLEK